jgi:molecular chaperone HscB
VAAVRASSSKSYFALLELPEHFALDPSELERRYREKSRHWHPDRFSRAPASERAAVLQRATELNEAYRTLRSDGKRAEYLLKLHGVDVSDETKKPALDPMFLAEILELREELADARVEADTARLASIKARIDAERHQLAVKLTDGFRRLEQQDPAALSELTEIVFLQRYYQRFVDDIAEFEESQASRTAVL